ncbi:FecR domain-containing protein [Pedobacter sp. JY14-1]|uniref:FecR family protein n=1 Tax=Pedobacter sp. JY14-1 TaxID=3034151 RepID=UPI0023E10BEC|nr:FecR domain-containing protein [Pedobacter sp. JY14-1]
MDQERLNELIDKYILGTASLAEQQELLSWYNGRNEGDVIWESVNENEAELVRMRILDRINAATRPRKKVFSLVRIAGIAAAVATIVFGLWFYKSNFSTRHSEDTRNLLNTANDIGPGKYGATITLANGQVIQLDSAKKGVVVGGAAGSTGLLYDDGSSLRGGTTKQSPLHGEIASEAAQPRNDVLVATTAKGQTYTFTLPDGTRVWLNADSKLEFPDQFSGKERKILLQGEAYFAVKHNAQQPFRVVSKTPDGKAQVVEDIGTEFNINAYADESVVKTTLVEGAARVIPINLVRHSDDRRNLLNGKDKGSLAALEMTGRDGIVLAPDKQATFSDGKLTVKTVDAMAAVAWKEGLFVYNATPLEEVMRQIARWYNVEIQYEKESLKKVPMGGAVSRYDNVSRILKTLENTGAVKFKLKGRSINVSE